MKKTIALLTACGLLLTSATACGSGENSIEDTVEAYLNCNDDGAAWMSLMPEDCVEDVVEHLNSIIESNGHEAYSDEKICSTMADIYETPTGQIVSIDTTVECEKGDDKFQTLIDVFDECEYLNRFDVDNIDEIVVLQYSYCEDGSEDTDTDTCSLFLYEGKWYSLNILSNAISFSEVTTDWNE